MQLLVLTLAVAASLLVKDAYASPTPDFSILKFGGVIADEYACPFNFSANSCFNVATVNEPFRSKCYGLHTCIDVQPSDPPTPGPQCVSCTGNTGSGANDYHVYYKDYPKETLNTDPFDARVLWPHGVQNAPVMVFVPTRAGRLSENVYQQFLDHVVSMGIVVVFLDGTPDGLGDQLFNLFYPDLQEKITPIINYITGGDLAADMAEPGRGGSTPRVDKLIYGGHGQGARIMLQRIKEQSCTGGFFGAEECECENGLVGGVVMLSPVEDVSENVDVGNGVIVQENVRVAWTTPALLINGKLDSVPVNNFAECAPESISADHFYNNWEGPIFAVEFQNFGHHDISDRDNDGDDCENGIHSGFVADDPNPGIIDPPLEKSMKLNLYRRAVSGMVAAFIDGLMNDRPEAFEVMQSDQDDIRIVSPWNVQTLRIQEHKRKGMADDHLTTGIEPFCDYRGALFSDEVQILVYATTALVALGVFAGIPYGYYKCIHLPLQKMKEGLADEIKVELAEENLIKYKPNQTPNPTFKTNGLQKLNVPPGMGGDDDGLSAISSVQGYGGDGEESVVPYSVAGGFSQVGGNRESTQTGRGDDDIF